MIETPGVCPRNGVPYPDDDDDDDAEDGVNVIEMRVSRGSLEGG